ncbi:hypothetical protein [Halovenus halobia]|uniref:hypothetical protein n=1 Tax=Halovenus halobia TaxID=3396622 RepID=UPI003F553504
MTDGAPVDWDRLDRIAERLASNERFRCVESEPAVAPERVVCVYDPTLYPQQVQEARLEITWFQNGDFSIHYHEDHDASTFDHRWDRHPSEHNTREHVHPGPDAPTPGDDATHPTDWRDVLSAVLEEIAERRRGFW